MNKEETNENIIFFCVCLILTQCHKPCRTASAPEMNGCNWEIEITRFPRIYSFRTIAHIRHECDKIGVRFFHSTTATEHIDFFFFSFYPMALGAMWTGNWRKSILAPNTCVFSLTCIDGRLYAIGGWLSYHFWPLTGHAVYNTTHISRSLDCPVWIAASHTASVWRYINCIDTHR